MRTPVRAEPSLKYGPLLVWELTPAGGTLLGG